MTSDYTLFRFSRVNDYLLDSLKKSYLYFAHPSNLNDPFDCTVDVEKSLASAIRQCSDEKMKLALETLQGGKALHHAKDLARNCGVLSFSSGKIPLNGTNSTLMWSHYAENHKGVCLTYSFPKTWFHENSSNIVGTQRVKYGINLLTSWFLKEKGGYYSKLKNNGETEAEIELLKKLLTIKNKCWKYEEEARIIKQTEGQFGISRSLLRQICFGLNTPASDIELIQNICQADGYEVGFCRVVRGQDDFGLEIIEMN